MPVRRVSVVGFCSLFAATALFGGASPMAVSPGSPTGTLIGDTCPTFSWSEAEGARGYELVVYRLGEEAEQVLRQSFAGPVDSWTPSLDRCLAQGGRYAWSVGVVGRKGASKWSPPSLFEVAAADPEAEFREALQIVRRYLALGEASGAPNRYESSDLDGAETDSSLPRSVAGAVPRPPTRAPGPITTALSLDDNLFMARPDTPVLRLHQDGTGIFSEYTWDVAGNETNFFVRDESTGIIPFKILPGAPVDSLVVQATGQTAVSSIVGNGAGLTNVTASDIACVECVDSAHIGAGQVGQDHIANIRGVSVECNGECTDGTLGEICGSPAAEPIAVSCKQPVDFAGSACGGDNLCGGHSNLFAGTNLGFFCEDTTGKDAVVFCID